MNQKKDYVLRWIPKYSIIPLITALVLNTLVYSGTMVLCKGLYHHDFTTAFDRYGTGDPRIYKYLFDMLCVLGCELHYDCENQ